MIFVSVVQLGYTDSMLYGPFGSIDEGKRELTDVKTRGDDEYETKYTFFKTAKKGMVEIGYVLFYEEYEENGLEAKREEYFPNV
jgi:hypothetical protein